MSRPYRRPLPGEGEIPIFRIHHFKILNNLFLLNLRMIIQSLIALIRGLYYRSLFGMMKLMMTNPKKLKLLKNIVLIPNLLLIQIPLLILCNVFDLVPLSTMGSRQSGAFM